MSVHRVAGGDEVLDRALERDEVEAGLSGRAVPITQPGSSQFHKNGLLLCHELRKLDRADFTTAANEQQQRVELLQTSCSTTTIRKASDGLGKVVSRAVYAPRSFARFGSSSRSAPERASPRTIGVVYRPYGAVERFGHEPVARAGF